MSRRTIQSDAERLLRLRRTGPRTPDSGLRPPRLPGFTLIEMLVVVSIIVLVVAITFPLLGAMSASVRGDSGLNTIHVAVASARAYATRDVGGQLAATGGRYSGTAIIFTPTNEMRIVENTVDSGPTFDQNGYESIPGRDYVLLSDDLGVVGIARGGVTATEVFLLTPPFAVRFDQHGQLIAGRDLLTRAHSVFYDSDYDGSIDVNSDRSDLAPYDPDDWDPKSPNEPNVPVDVDNGYYQPFDRLDAVIGVVLYNKKELRAAGHDLEPGAGDALDLAAHQWLLRDGNGTTVFFGRYSGAAMAND